MMRIFNKLLLLVFCLFLLCPCPKIYGQQKPSFGACDSLTYRDYLRQDWPAIIRDGKLTLNAGYDYYYLRMRLAAACFEAGKYRGAITHYSKAAGFNSGEESVTRNKYYSYLNLGDRDQAAFMARLISTPHKKSLNISSGRPVDFIYLESGYTPSAGQGIPVGRLSGGDSIYGQEDIYKSLFYTQAGIRFRLLPSLALYASYTGLNVEKEKRFNYSVYNAQRDSVVTVPYGLAYFYSFPRQWTNKVIPYKVTQNEIYLNASYIPAEGFRIIPAFHLIQVRTWNILPVYSTTQQSDTAFFLASDTSWHLFTYPGYVIREKDTSFSNWVLSLSVTKDMGNFSFDLHASFSDFNSGKQSQGGVSVSWYPLGNTAFFSTTSVNGVSAAGGKRFIYEQLLGARLTRFAWIDGFITSGNLNLYNEKNASVVYNQSDPITFRFGADALIAAGKHLEIYLVYRYARKEFLYQQYTLSNTEVSFKSTYTNHSLIGGLKWKF